MTRLWMSALAFAVLQIVGMLGRGVPTSMSSSDLPLLAQSDITYDSCYFNIAPQSNDSPFEMGLTGRYVSGDLRLLVGGQAGGNAIGVFEYSLSGKGCGDTVNVLTNTWLYPWDAASTTPHGNIGSECYNLWWDGSKLWTVEGTNCTAYGAGPDVPVQIYTRTLNSNGTVSGVHGPIGLQGVPDRRVFSGCSAVPSALQSRYSWPAFACGFGGYFSVATAYGGASFGPTLYLLPDPAGYSDSTEIPSGTFKTAMDAYSSQSVSPTDWYNGTGLSNPNTFDRGVRSTSDFTNYFDNGDPRSNPQGCSSTANTSGTSVTLTGSPCAPATDHWWAGFSVTGRSAVPAATVTINSVSYTVSTVIDTSHITLTTGAGTQTGVSFVGPDPRPTFLPATSAGWLDPEPNGRHPWTWGDNYAAGIFIRGTSKQGFLAVANVCQGDCYYSQSTLVFDAREYEFHIYDPAQIASGVSGSLPAWNVKPTSTWGVALPGTSTAGSSFVGLGNVTGAWFDTTTNKLWLQIAGAGSTFVNRLYRFSVSI